MPQMQKIEHTIFLISLLRDLSRDPVDSPIQGQNGMQPPELRVLISIIFVMTPVGITTRPLLSVFKSSWGPR